MEFYQLEYFRVLCKHGNFTSASEELMVTQPAVSTAVKKLEEEYGVELIDRQGKAFTLTRMGEVVLKHAVAIHNEVSSLRDEVGAGFQKKREVIRVALPLTMCPRLLPELMSNFAVEHKEISLNLLQNGHAAIVAGLAGRSIDLGVVSKDVTNVLLSWCDYTKMEIFAAFSPDHRLNQYESVTPEMLAEESVVFSRMIQSPPGYIEAYFQAHGIDPHRIYHNGFPDTSVQLARRGLGVALAPRHIAGDKCLPLSPPLYCDLVVAWNKKVVLTREEKTLIDFIVGTDPEAAPA